MTLRRLSIEDRPASGPDGLPTRQHTAPGRLQGWRSQTRRGSTLEEPNLAPPAEEAQNDAGGAELRASQAESEAHDLAENLRREGLARARSIIANAEREAHAVIQSAREAAAVAEGQARARVEGILAGRFPPDADAPPATGNQSTPRASHQKVAELPAEGSTLRYQITVPLSFAAMLKLKQDIARFPGVSLVNIAPISTSESVLSLQATDASEVLRRLQSMPSLAEARE